MTVSRHSSNDRRTGSAPTFRERDQLQGLTRVAACAHVSRRRGADDRIPRIGSEEKPTTRSVGRALPSPGLLRLRVDGDPDPAPDSNAAASAASTCPAHAMRVVRRRRTSLARKVHASGSMTTCREMMPARLPDSIARRARVSAFLASRSRRRRTFSASSSASAAAIRCCVSSHSRSSRPWIT